jgi:3-oxoacyl-(acyl-carrier-protein) synthase
MKVNSNRLPYPPTQRVAITGLGGVCSLGDSVPEITRSLMSGKSGITAIGGPHAGEFGPTAAWTKHPSIKTDIHPQLARTMGKHLSLLLASTEQALRSAAIVPGMFDPRDIGFFVGMGMVDYHVEDLLGAVLKSLDQFGDLDYDRFFSAGYQEIYPLWPLGMLNNVAFCQAAIHFGLRGENGVFSPHGDSGVQAVAEAVRVLREGKAKVALAGGVSEEISPLSLGRASLNGLTRTPGELLEPGAEIFLGEGGAMLVLEPLSNALERQANVLAEIAGFGFAFGKEDNGGFPPPQAISSAISGALRNASLGPGQIDLIMSGGLDRSEAEAVREIFGVGADAPVIAATTKAFGEMFAAGPILNTAIGLTIPEHASLPFCLPSSVNRPRPWGRILINGISYEGGCASMIVEKTGGETA